MSPLGDQAAFGDSELSAAIAEMLAAEIEAGELPSASWIVTQGGAVVSRGALGQAVVEPERIAASPSTIYDLASLTKPLVTTTLALIAAAEGRIDLDDPVSWTVSELSAARQFAGATWGDILSHRAGFEAWYPLYVEGRDRGSYLTTMLSRPLAYEPGLGVVYSDLGFILLSIALERVWDQSFEVLVGTKLLKPLGVERCRFHPPADLRALVAATERGNQKEKAMVRSLGLSFEDWREGVIWGEVNDCNAHYLGGVSGHAGLFGDSESVALLSSTYLARRGFLPEPLRAKSVDCQAESETDRRGLGWQLRTDTNPAAPLSASAFGHTGFTGTSVWVDPAGDLVVVLLTNRIHPDVRESRIQEIRRQMNELVAKTYL